MLAIDKMEKLLLRTFFFVRCAQIGGIFLISLHISVDFSCIEMSKSKTLHTLLIHTWQKKQKKVVFKPPNNDWLCIVQCAKYWNVGNEFNRINHMIFEMCWFSTTVHKKKLMHIRCNCSRFGWFCFGVDCLLQFYTIHIGYYPESLSVLDSIPKKYHWLFKMPLPAFFNSSGTGMSMPRASWQSLENLI